MSEDPDQNNTLWMDLTKVIAIILVGVIYILDRENVDIAPWLIGIGLASIVIFLVVMGLQSIKSSRTK
jgi:hypothetical protein